MEDIGPILNLIREKEGDYFGRMFVDQPIVTHQGKDNLLFDGTSLLNADYLVTMDNKLKNKNLIQKPKLIQPGDFLHKVLKIV